MGCRKKLQGPPSEFAQHRIPEPVQAAEISESVWLELVFTRNTENPSCFLWKDVFIVDSPEELDISLFSPYEDKLDIVVQPPGGSAFSLKLNNATRRHFESTGTASAEPSFIKVRRAGAWRLQL